jgi:hypothetical protein
MDGAAQILRALLVDSFRSDLATLARTNRRLRLRSQAPQTQSSADPSEHRVVEFCVLNPRGDELSKVAARAWPSGLLSFLRSLGGYGALGRLTRQRQVPGQFLSYLCFAHDFLCAAIDAGIADAEELVQRSGGRIPWTTEQLPGAP